MIMNKLVIAFLLLFIPGMNIGQSIPNDKPGFPFVKNFAPADYRAHAQNFAVANDRSGMVYFGNFAGVLQFDGETWRLIPTEKTTKVSALAVDSSGTIYVGARGEIGFLEANDTGQLVYKSLLNNQKLIYPPFTDINQIYVTPSGIVFIAGNLIFTLKDKKLDVWKAPADIMGSFYINDQFYLQLLNIGLMRFRNGSLEPFADSRFFSGAIQIKAMLPAPDGKIIIATGTQGLYFMEGEKISKFNVPANDLLMQNPVTCGLKLVDGTYALGTSRQGIIIINSTGKILQIVDKKAGLRNNFVQALYQGKNGLLWTALNNGISFVEVPSPLTFFDAKSGLSGGANHILRFDNTLYVSTYQGLFYYDDNSFSFLPIPRIITACWQVVQYENYLVAATSEGIFLVRDKKATLIKEGFALSIVRSINDPSMMTVGEMKGLYSLKKQGNQWIDQKIECPEEEINDLQQDGFGNIWGSTLTKGVFRFAPGDRAPEYLTQKDGLPENSGCSINLIGKQMSVSTRQGVYFFNEQTRRFYPVSLFSDNGSTEDQWFSIITPAVDGNLWVNQGDETHIMQLIKKGDKYQPLKVPFSSIADLVIWTIYPEANGITWFGGPDGLIRYDPAIQNRNLDPPPTIIRKITLGNDSVVYFGNETPGQSHEILKNLIIEHSENTIMFEFSAPYFASKGENKYQYILEGFDETWSDWTLQTQKEYTNLPAGKFVFRVKSRNLYGNLAQETTVSFRILSPWYTTIWAFALYILVAGGGIYLIVILRNRQLIKEKRILEQRIEERTAEVVQQKEEILSQTEELENKNDELEKINTAVKSINAEVNFENLIQALLEKMQIMRPVEKSSALVFDKNINAYKFKAGFGYDLGILNKAVLTFAQAENRYLKNTEEVFEDIFLKTDFTGNPDISDIPELNQMGQPKAMLVLVIRVENKVEAFLIFANYSRTNAFEPKDLSFLKNSKEHIISAFIRTRILEDLQLTLQNLKATQDQLVQSEKLASLGALTAGIAHEIQNPLNFVNNFSSLSAELADELLDVLKGAKDSITPDQCADFEELIGMVKGNMTKIHDHGKRAESIVKGMLQHSRGKTGEFEKTEMNNMVAEYVNLAYHGMRAKDKSFNTSIKTILDPNVGSAMVIPQDLSRVILNIVNNACYAVDEKAKKKISGFAPEVMVSTKKLGNMIEIRIRDNGTGMPESVKEKIFNPFFTTKPTGQGTGLGLSMSFDIVNQVHKGKLEVISKDGEFTEFIITIPEKQV